ncbi:MAG: hypothetical protein ACTSUD_00550 [Alphaproteobacteria bacterium]
MARTVGPIGKSISPRRDVIAGVTVGLAIALAFGTPVLGAIEAYWYRTALPAFSTLAESGIGWCG